MMCVCEIRTSDLCVNVLCSGEQNLITILDMYWFHMQCYLHSAEVLLCNMQPAAWCEILPHFSVFTL